MGNSLGKVEIFPADTSISFSIASDDGMNAVFVFNFWRDSSTSNPQYRLILGDASNTLLVMEKLNEDNGGVVDSVNMGNFTIPLVAENFDIEICGETLLLLDSESDEVIGQYSDSDMRDMTLYSGHGSDHTVVVVSQPSHSAMASCGTSSFSSTSSSSHPKKKRFPAWAIALIVIAVVAFVAAGIAVYMLFRKKYLNKIKSK